MGGGGEGRCVPERTVAAGGVFIMYAPPARVFLHALHFQIPVACTHKAQKRISHTPGAH